MSQASGAPKEEKSSAKAKAKGKPKEKGQPKQEEKSPVTPMKRPSALRRGKSEVNLPSSASAAKKKDEAEDAAEKKDEDGKSDPAAKRMKRPAVKEEGQS